MCCLNKKYKYLAPAIWIIVFQESGRWYIAVSSIQYPHFLFVLRQAASCSFTKLSSVHNAQHSWLRKLVWSRSASFFCCWGGLRLDHVLTTNELYQSSFVSEPRAPLQPDLAVVVLGLTWVWLLCSDLPKRTSLRGKTNQSSSQPN